MAAQPRTSPGPPAVAMLMDAQRNYAREQLAGIVGHIESGPPGARWRVLYWPGRSRHELTAELMADADGVLCSGHLDAIAREFLPDAPRVIVGSITSPDQSDSVCVMPDEHAVGAMAADDLIERGYGRFIAVGPMLDVYAERRIAGFRQRLVESRIPPEAIQRVDAVKSQVEPSQVARLPADSGVFCVSDNIAWRFLAACQQAGRAVPEDLSVIGVDNDPLLTRLATPRLSSIELDNVRIGREAARLLDRMLAGEAVRPGLRLVPPVSLIERESSNRYAVEDEAVRQAIHYMQGHFHEGIEMEDVMQAVLISRRTLELRFRKALGRSPYEVLVGLRLARARQMLLHTRCGMGEIATSCGFANHSQFAAAFRRRVGCSPDIFRRRHRDAR